MSAPSFSSFPPTFGSFPDLEEGPSKRSKSPRGEVKTRKKEKHGNKSERRGGERETKRKPSEKGHRDGSHRRERSRERHRVKKETRDRSGRDHPPKDVKDEFCYEDTHSNSHIYYSDRRGDSLNVTYGGLHAGDIPKYSLVNRGRKVLGLDMSWTVVYRSGKGVEIASGDRRKVPQLSDRSTHALLTAGNVRRLLTGSKDQSKYLEVDGFMRLPSRQGRVDAQAYRSITADDNDNSDSQSSASDVEDDRSSGDDSDTVPTDSRQEMLRALEQKLIAQPTSVPTWLSLLDHSLSSIPPNTKNATKVRSEITMAILSRALSVSSENQHSTYLRLKHLKAGEQLWDTSKLRSEWEDALAVVRDPDLWMEWFDWKIRAGAGGTDDVVADAVRAYENIGVDLNTVDAELARLRIFWRIARFFEDAGFTERSTALFQAQAELAFKAPKDISKLPIETQLDKLEEFWESEVPRLGELHAQGWHNWNPSDAMDTSSSVAAAPPIGQGGEQAEDPYSRWAAYELDQHRTYKLPLRAAHDENTDPYSTILFSDIQPLLLSLKTTKSKETFRLIWLSFLGLHVPGLSASLSALGIDDKWSSAHLASESFLASLFPNESSKLITADSFAGVTVGRQKKYRKTFGLIKEWGSDVLGPLQGMSIDVSGRMWEAFSGDVEFTRRVFQQLRTCSEDTTWVCLALAFEAALNVKSALKMSKTLLVDARHSMELWAAHGRLECIRGRYEEARKIYQTVLASAESNSGWRSQLWWDYAELEWLSSENCKAVGIIMNAAGESNSTSSVSILRTKRCLDELARNPNARTWREQYCWIKLRVLLEVINGTVQAAAKIADGYLKDEQEGSVQHESLTVAMLLIVYHDIVTLRHPCPPAFLRGRVQKATETYPSNTVVLGLFLECEKGEGVWGRVRNLLGDSGEARAREKSVTRRVAEVWMAGWEKGRWEAEAERVRARLAAAVTSDRTCGSATLWRIYIEFEIKARQLKNAKNLLFQAVGECPMVKELYLLAFRRPLRTAFTAAELNIFAETMAERGIRLRRSLEDELTGWHEEGVEQSASDIDEVEGDLEYNASELRRLRPY